MGNNTKQFARPQGMKKDCSTESCRGNHIQLPAHCYLLEGVGVAPKSVDWGRLKVRHLGSGCVMAGHHTPGTDRAILGACDQKATPTVQRAARDWCSMGPIHNGQDPFWPPHS
uniref:Uncharacterized protein n=1 Tax=Eutreptiella gymnastica TaxID=73025 RepID=A0A7S1NLL4_9EUGL